MAVTYETPPSEVIPPTAGIRDLGKGSRPGHVPILAKLFGDKVTGIKIEDPDSQQALLKAESGFHTNARRGTHLNGMNGARAEEEEKKTQDAVTASQRTWSQILQIGEKSFSFNDVTNFISSDIRTAEAMRDINGAFSKPVTPQDMLRDTQGNIIKTIEEKRAMEAQQGACHVGLSAEEVHRGDDGKLYSVSALAFDQQMRERLEQRQQVLRDLQSGKLKLNDLPPEIKTQLAENAPQVNPTTASPSMSGFQAALAKMSAAPILTPPAPALQ
ncbi:MAG: hypothetical protein J0L77_08055 [Alphaproteobacteria bacterium]|nr:hypothetical protein [Alphaproteobacteria bacterium]